MHPVELIPPTTYRLSESSSTSRTSDVTKYVSPWIAAISSHRWCVEGPTGARSRGVTSRACEYARGGEWGDFVQHELTLGALFGHVGTQRSHQVAEHIADSAARDVFVVVTSRVGSGLLSTAGSTT